MTATLATRRALQRKLLASGQPLSLADSLRRMRADVWPTFIGGNAWRVRLELWPGKTEYGPPPGADLRGKVGYVRMPRGRRYVTALGEAVALADAVGMALVLLDEQLERGWYAVKLEPSALWIANRRHYDPLDLSQARGADLDNLGSLVDIERSRRRA